MKKTMQILTLVLVGLGLCASLPSYGQMSAEARASLEAYAERQAEDYKNYQAALTAEARELNIPLTKRVGERQLRLVAIQKGYPLYEADYNTVSQRSASADQVKVGGLDGLNLTGAGVQMGIWEAGGLVMDTHAEFDGRVTLRDGGDMTCHATHVAGTMIAVGVDPTAEGYANAADLDSYDSSNDLAEMAAAAAAADNPIVISNHSYGWVLGWNFNDDTGMWEYNGGGGTTEDWRFGAYVGETANWDQTAYNATHLLIVKSAGNDRGDGPNMPQPGDPPRDGGVTGFDCLPARGTAKNIVTVAAARANAFGNYTGPGDVSMTVFSSWGPTDDGRIKPDIAANGSFLYSPGFDADNGTATYATKSGTSMAAPSVSGGAALLYEHWDNVLGGTPSAAVMKGLLLESADEAGFANGPDYVYGWGMMNVSDAAQLITVEGFNGCSQYYEGDIDEGETFELEVESSGEELMKVMLVWHDPAATNLNGGTIDPAGVRYLVNDLDLRVTGNGNTFMPWVMNPAQPGNGATTGNNDRDNVEQVLMLTPTAGTYTISVSAPAMLTNGPQRFTLWWMGTDATDDIVVVNNETFNTTPETFAADEAVLFADAGAPGTVDVLPGGDVESYAGEEIRLRPGFHAQAGSHFLAQIKPGGGCGEFTAERKRDNYPELPPMPLASAPETVEETTTAARTETTVAGPVTKLQVSPNPTRTRTTLWLDIPTASEKAVLKIVNQLGQLVWQQVIAVQTGEQALELDCSSWAPGLYYVDLQTESGSVRQTLVVQR